MQVTKLIYPETPIIGPFDCPMCDKEAIAILDHPGSLIIIHEGGEHCVAWRVNKATREEIEKRWPSPTIEGTALKAEGGILKIWDKE